MKPTQDDVRLAIERLEGDGNPSTASAIAEALGIATGELKRVLEEMRSAGVLTEVFKYVQGQP
jgi:DNA-binding IscR family transcriptional regulator